MASSHRVSLLSPLGPGEGTHIDSEVLGGAGDGALGREGFRDVLQRHSCRADDAGEADDGEAKGPTKRPAVPGVDVWLRAQKQDTSSVITISAIFLPPSINLAACLEQHWEPNKTHQTHTRTSPAGPPPSVGSRREGAYLQDDTGGLRVVPQGDAEQAQRLPCPVGLRAAGVDDAGPWHAEGTAAGELACHQPVGPPPQDGWLIPGGQEPHHHLPADSKA